MKHTDLEPTDNADFVMIINADFDLIVNADLELHVNPGGRPSGPTERSTAGG
jgi:hypothetical protein